MSFMLLDLTLKIYFSYCTCTCFYCFGFLRFDILIALIDSSVRGLYGYGYGGEAYSDQSVSRGSTPGLPHPVAM